MKLSIITINYNDATGLAKTLKSVADQHIIPDGFLLEHIIVDGGSTDGSVEVIRDYATVHHTLYTIRWVSEKDKGVYNAMNKGIEIALGRRKVNDFNRSKRSEDKYAQRSTEWENKVGEHYIQILNSGDILASSDVLAKMYDFVKRYTVHRPKAATPYIENAGIFYGNMIRQRADGTIEGKSGQVPYSLLNYFTSTMNHDCCWIKRSLFEEYGLYDENLKIVSDWKWFLQAIGLGHVKPVYVDIDMTIFDTTGISERNLEVRNEERRKVFEDVLPPAVLADYDKHAFDMHQMDNLRKHPWAYKLVWTLERVLNRLDNKNFRKPKNK